MPHFTFTAVSGNFLVVVPDETSSFDLHELWIEAVGQTLRGNQALFSEYTAAGFSQLTSAALRLRVTRHTGLYSPKQLGLLHTTTYSPHDTPHTHCHDSRSHGRNFRRAIEAHWHSVRVLIGSLFPSLHAFKTANRVLSMESATDRDQNNRMRRRRIRVLDGITLPAFHDLDHFTRDLVAWASQRGPMGTMVSCTTYIIDYLVEALQSPVCFVGGVGWCPLAFRPNIP